MCRRLFALSLAVLITLYIYTPCGASFTYYDDFTYDSPEKAYFNLEYKTTGVLSYAGFGSAPTRSHGYYAEATYYIQGVKSIKLSTYTMLGSSYHYDPGFQQWVLGHGSYIDDLTPIINSPQAYFGTAQDDTAAIFALIDGEYYRMYWDKDKSAYAFCPQEDSSYKPINLRYYGVNVYADGKQLPLTRTNAVYYREYGKCLEEFSVEVPEGTGKITVEINDIWVIPHKPSGENPKIESRTTGIRYVELTGEDLIPTEMPLTPEETNKPPSTQNNDGESESSSSKSRTSRSGSSKAQSSAPLPIQAPSAGSKPAGQSALPYSFSSSQSRSSSEPKVSPVPLQSSEKPRPESADTPEQEPEASQTTPAEAPQPQIYIVERPQNSPAPKVTLASVYVVLASASVVAVILRGGKGR